MTSTLTFKFFTFSVFLSLVFQVQADETTAMLRLTIDGEKIRSGACLLSTTDFETAKFSIVDEDGQLLEKFKIIDGSLDWGNFAPFGSLVDFTRWYNGCSCNFVIIYRAR